MSRLAGSFLKKPEGVADLPLLSLSSPSRYGLSHSGPLILNDATLKPCLFGSNKIEGVDVSGWTYCTRTVHVNEHNSAIVKSMGLNIVTESELKADAPVGVVKRYYKKHSSFFKTLDQLSVTAPSFFSNFSYIIDVIVVGKMGVEMSKSTTSNDVLFFGNILIGDSTGVALLKTINQEVLTLYDNISVGDRLILTGGNYRNSVDDYVMFPAFEPHFLPLTIKLYYYHVKKGFKILRDDTKLHSFPEILASSFNLLMPSDILRSVESGTILEHMDILGIITSASRKWRERGNDNITINVHKEENYSHKLNMTLPLYTIVQCIEIIDNSNKPISIRVNFTEEQFRKEINFVPGAAIVLTLCQLSKCGQKGIGPLVETSKFTQIYMNMDIKYYLHTVPLSLQNSMKEKLSEIVSLAVSYDIFKRKNVLWTVGGSFSSPIIDQSKFLAHYKTNKTKLILPLIRRENFFHVFKGQILRVMTVRKEWGSDEWEWTNPILRDKSRLKTIPPHCSDELHDGVPLSERNCTYWYSFRRLLPTLNVEEFPKHSSSDISRVFYNEHVVSHFTPYTLASNMPIPSLQSLIALKKLKAVDSYPYFILDVLNLDEENMKLKRKFFLWKSCSGLTFDDMEKKLEELRENILVFSTQVYRRESYNLQHYMGYELLIDDFMKYS